MCGVSTRPKLYPAQAEGVARFLSAPSKRLVLAYGTGVGKTPTAITALNVWWGQRRNVKREPRILVVCPAIVRRHWCKEFRRWANIDARPIEMGRLRQSGTKAALKARDEAYANNVQIVSFDLCHEVEAEGWDAVVLDEVHHLADCQSKQSRVVRTLLRANPGVPVLGLSATLIPTRIEQLWHPLHLLFGDAWGARPKAGSICWQFAGRYCEVERTEYGSKVGRARAKMMPELKGRLRKVCHRLTREDISDHLPPLDVKTLEVPGNTLARGMHVVGSSVRQRPEVEHAIAWVRALASDIRHAVILCYHRDVARQIQAEATRLADWRASCPIIDGTMTTDERVRALDNCELSPRSLLIATSESIREGVRLMWAQKVLFAEWRQSPAQVWQVMGRFQSVGDSRRPQIEVLIDESLYGQAKVLTDRMGAIDGALKTSTSEAAVAEVFGPKELTEERMAELTQQMLASFKPSDRDWLEDEAYDEDA